MISNIDWSFMKRTLIVFSIAILLTIAFVVMGNEYQKEKTQVYNQAKASLAATHDRYQKLVEDIDLLAQYTIAYDEYKSSGLLGEERRLSWIETLETVNDKLKLPLLSYSLMPQETYNVAQLKTEKNVILKSTPMNLKIDLLHEEDLFAVVQEIDSNIANLFTVDSCQISRKATKGEPLNTQKANLSSNCLLRWVTVDVK